MDRLFLCGLTIMVQSFCILWKNFAQVRSVLIVMMNITFNLNVAARFFIVIYAHDFVKNSQLDLKLFRQIYWLAWVVHLGEKK